MPLSNSALLDELLSKKSYESSGLSEAQLAKINLSIVYQAVAQTEDKSFGIGIFKDKAKNIEDVRDKIVELVKANGAAANEVG